MRLIKLFILLLLLSNDIFSMCEPNQVNIKELFANESEQEIINFIESCNDINDINVCMQGRTLLAWAIGYNKVEVVKFLVENSANVNQISCGFLPLYLVMLEENYEMLQLLLSFGANPYEKDKFGISPINYARLFKLKNLVKFFEEYRGQKCFYKY